MTAANKIIKTITATNFFILFPIIKNTPKLGLYEPLKENLIFTNHLKKFLDKDQNSVHS